MAQAILSIGSNLGDRLKNIKKAINALNTLTETEVLSVSNYYETEPFGVSQPQGKYINCCVKLETSLDPEFLMGACLGIESFLGRIRTYEFCPRTIDIDIVAYENKIINEKNLILPHPRFLQRAFVLVPLKDIFPDMYCFDINFEPYLKKCNLSVVNKIEYI